MSKEHHLKTRKPSGLAKGVPLNFLLGCSENSLANFILARYAEASDLRRELLAIIDRLIEQMMLARLGEWFKDTDRNALRHAIENEETAEEWAARMVRNQGRSEGEIGEDGYLFPRPSLPPGAAHLAGAKRYAERNIAEGLCSLCPKPLARNSVRYCEEHLAKIRARDQQKKGLSLPGGREYLYSGEVTESTHGRQPGTLASLAINREKKTRAVLAEMGLPSESAAVSLKAAKEALLKCMPDRKHAMTQADLFEKAGVITKTTGQRALNELVSEGKVKRLGKGGMREPFRYFATQGLKRVTREANFGWGLEKRVRKSV